MPQYELYPYKAAEFVWRLSKKNSAPNGALMRTCILGIWDWQNAAGGDTDTNGAVAGALMGARMGYAALPETWVTGLLNKELLEERIERIIRHSNMANI